jgi:hypothetical protein
MVLPRDELSVKLSHTGMHNGNVVIKRLIVSLLANSQLGGTPGATAFPRTSSRRQIALPCGLSSALQKLSSWLASLIPMSSTSTYILHRSEPALAAAWVVWNHYLPCSATGTQRLTHRTRERELTSDMTRFTAGRKKMSRKISFRKRGFNFF